MSQMYGYKLILSLGQHGNVFPRPPFFRDDGAWYVNRPRIFLFESIDENWSHKYTWTMEICTGS